MASNYDESRLSAPALLAASPIHAGVAMKLHVPVLYEALPATVQWILSRCGPRSWLPQWKRRYLIALGEYLYRFKDQDGAAPKGSPLPAATTESRIAPHEEEHSELSSVFGVFPEGFNTVFAVSSVGKTQYFAVESQEEARVWVNSLRQMRDGAITRKMGHSASVPYPAEWTAFDFSAKRLASQKDRIKRRLAAMDRKEQEMVSMGGVFG